MNSSGEATGGRVPGRQFFFNPGPTHIPESVFNAMHRPVIDFLAPEFIEVLNRVHERTKRVLKTEQHLLYYGTNGHGAWEGALANVFSPGDKMLMIEFGPLLDQLGQDGRGTRSRGRDAAGRLAPRRAGGRA